MRRLICSISIAVLLAALSLPVFAADNTSYKISGGLSASSGASVNGTTWTLPRTSYKCTYTYVIFQTGSSDFKLVANGDKKGTQVYNSGQFYVYRFGDVAGKSSTTGDTWTLTFRSTSWITIYSVKGYPDVTSYSVTTGFTYRAVDPDTYVNNTAGYKSTTLPAVLSYKASYCLDLRILGSSLNGCDYVTIPFSISGTDTASIYDVSVYRNGAIVDSDLVSLQLDGWTDTGDDATYQTQYGTLVINDPVVSGFYVIRFRPRYDAVTSDSNQIAIHNVICSWANVPDTDDYTRWQSDLQASIDATLKQHTGLLGSIKDGISRIVNYLGLGADTDDYQDQVADQNKELDNLSNSLNQVTRPDIDDVNPDDTVLDKIEDVQTLGQIMAAPLNNSVIGGIIVLSLALALIGFVFYGKRG